MSNEKCCALRGKAEELCDAAEPFTKVEDRVAYVYGQIKSGQVQTLIDALSDMRRALSESE